MTRISLVAVFIFAVVGCRPSVSERLADNRPLTVREAVQLIAVSQTELEINSIQERLTANGGLETVLEFQKCLSDKRHPPYYWNDRDSYKWPPDVGDVCFRIIRGILTPKASGEAPGHFYPFSRYDIDEWLNDRRGCTLKQLQVEVSKHVLSEAIAHKNYYSSMEMGKDAEPVIEAFSLALQKLELDQNSEAK